MPGARPVYVVGFSGMGKTTFVNSALLAWAALGIKVDVMPLETPARMVRLKLAALEAHVDPGLISSGDYKQREDAKELYDRVNASWKAQRTTILWDDVHAGHDQHPIRIHDAMGLDLLGLTMVCEAAVERGCRVVVVDHVDHLTEAQDMFASTVSVNRGAQRLAEKHGLVMILLSQANNEALKGNSDHMAKYAPLRDSSVWMGSLKRQLASQMIGLFRPVREPHRDETPEQYKEAVRKAKAGHEPPATVLQSGAFGVSLMKSENYGSREGQRALLGWKNGAIVDYTQLPHTLR